MLSLVARKLSNAVPSSAYRALNVARKAPKRLHKKHVCQAMRRYYATETPSTWSAEDLAVLGTYKGTPTPRGQKKTSTGLVGIEVQPEARDVLIALYTKIAQELAKLPKDYAYRVDNELYIQQRMAILLEETDPIRLEEEIDSGQLEVLIEEAESELHHTLPTLLELKPWAQPTSRWETSAPYIYSDINVLG